jgi:hypothetical protein
MKSLNEYLEEYKRQIEKGDIKFAYKGLMEYVLHLRTYFTHNYPDFVVSGNIYQGYMDMTYFALNPAPLKNKKLKIAIVFLHDKIRFEIWLAGVNKQIQSKYWKIFNDNHFTTYRMPTDITGIDSIVEHDLIDQPDFDNFEILTRQIEIGTLKFIEDIMTFLDNNPN